MRKVKLAAVILIWLMSLMAYFRHINPTMSPSGHATYQIANTLDHHAQEFDELTPEHSELLAGYTESLIRSANSFELHQRRANLPFAFVLAGLSLISLLYIVELQENKTDRTSADAQEKEPTV